VRDPVFAYAAALVVAFLVSTPVLALTSRRRKWIRNWLLSFPYLSLIAALFVARALGIDVHIFDGGITVELFASAIAAIIAWFAVPIGMASYLDRRWH